MEKLRVVPAFKQNNIAIALSANNDFVPYTAVMIQSIIDNASDHNNYDIVVIHSEITADNQKLVLSMAKKKNVSIRFFDVSEMIKGYNFFVQSVYTKTQYSPEAYYRLLLPTLMPDYEKVVYVDGDMICRTDIAELYNTDVTNFLLASSRDYSGIALSYSTKKEFKDRMPYRRDVLKLKNPDNYFISGMLVLNIKEFNKKWTAKQLLDFASSRDWRQHDQDILNVLCEEKTLLLDGSWDFLEDISNLFNTLPVKLLEEYKASCENPKIVHFAGERKPCNSSRASYIDEFWQYAHKTPYFQILLDKVDRDKYAYLHYILKTVLNLDVETILKKDGICLKLNGKDLAFVSDAYLQIEKICFKEKDLTILGSAKLASFLFDLQPKLCVKFGTQEIVCEYGRLRNYKDVLGTKEVPFSVKINCENLAKSKAISFYFVIEKTKIEISKLDNQRFSPLSNMIGQSYYHQNSFIVSRCGDNNLVVEKSNCAKLFGHEVKFFFSVLKHAKQMGKKSLITLIMRYYHFFMKPFRTKKQVWLVCDRNEKAGDNGEAFFKFLCEKKPKNVKPIFLVSKKSKDYKRLKKHGKVVPYLSIRHMSQYLNAKKIISSQFHWEVFQIFTGNDSCIKDILSNKCLVFLQHGIIKDDMSDNLKVKDYYFDYFVTSTQKERDSILEYNYGYKPENVILTGLPRYDFLYNNPKKIITIAPTWRKDLSLNRDIKTGLWDFNKGFKESEYCKFYEALLRDERLIKTAQKLGYAIQFLAHPTMLPLADKYFSFDKSVKILDESVNYSDVYAQSCLMITDYSSLVFDFAYLKKPLFYTQFDLKNGGKHYKDGFFSYEDDGLGEVVYDLDSTINLIIEYMKNGCKLKEKYLHRIENFFAYTDKNNCKRVFDKITEND